MSPNKKMIKAKIYIDGANMFYAQQKMGWFIQGKILPLNKSLRPEGRSTVKLI